MELYISLSYPNTPSYTNITTYIYTQIHPRSTLKGGFVRKNQGKGCKRGGEAPFPQQIRLEKEKI